MGRRASRPRRRRVVELTDAQQDVVTPRATSCCLRAPDQGRPRAAAACARALADAGKKVAACSYTNVGADRIAAMLEPAARAAAFRRDRPHAAASLRRLSVRARRRSPARTRAAPGGLARRRGLRRPTGSGCPSTRSGSTRRATSILRIEPEDRSEARPRRSSRSDRGRCPRRKRGSSATAGMLSSDDAMWVALTMLHEYPELAERRRRALRRAAARRGAGHLRAAARLPRTSSSETGRSSRCVLIGDLEQSIFSFQGASAAGCRGLAGNLGLRDDELSENHRCSQKICDVAVHFCAREQPDTAVGDTCDCDDRARGGPLPRRTTRSDAMHSFRERLQTHADRPADAAVLARGNARWSKRSPARIVRSRVQERPNGSRDSPPRLAHGTT